MKTTREPITSTILEVQVPYKTKYHVETQSRNSQQRFRIATVTDYDEAVRKANFWDERMTTWLIEERPPRGALAVALWRFNYLIGKLESEQDERKL